MANPHHPELGGVHTMKHAKNNPRLISYYLYDSETFIFFIDQSYRTKKKVVECMTIHNKKW